MSHTRFYKSQRIMAAIYFLLVILTIIMNLITEAKRLDVNLFSLSINQLVTSFVFSLSAVAIANVLVFLFDTNWARHLHVAIFVFQSCYSFFNDGLSTFYPWGLFAISLLLAYRYGFLEKHPKRNLLSISILNAICLGLSFMFHGKSEYPSQLLATLIYIAFFFPFLFLIFQAEIKDTLRGKQQLIKERKELVAQKMMLEEAIYEPGQKNSENIRAKLAGIINEEQEINMRIRNHPRFSTLSDVEKDTISLFYIHRGGLTNKELAMIMGTSEETIKNRFHKTYQKTGLKSRAEIIAHMDAVI